MNQGGTTKQPDLCHIRRPVSWQTALSFNGFNHRAFFTANIGTCPAAQINIIRFNNTGINQTLDFFSKNMQNSRIFIPHIDKALFGFNGPCSNQHPFQKQMWGAFQIIAILESAGLALISIHGKIACAFGGTNKSPFLARREASTAQTTQSALMNLFLHVFPIPVLAQIKQFFISALSTISRKILIIRNMRMRVFGLDSRLNLFRSGVIYVVMANFQCRRGITTPHTWRPQHPHVRWIKPVLQCF